MCVCAQGGVENPRTVRSCKSLAWRHCQAMDEQIIVLVIVCVLVSTGNDSSTEAIKCTYLSHNLIMVTALVTHPPLRAHVLQAALEISIPIRRSFQVCILSHNVIIAAALVVHNHPHVVFRSHFISAYSTAEMSKHVPRYLQENWKSDRKEDASCVSGEFPCLRVTLLKSVEVCGKNLKFLFLRVVL